MLKSILLAATLGMAVAIGAASAQTGQSGHEAGLVGLPVYSSDGQMVGQVTEVAGTGPKPAVRAELGTFLGLGTANVFIDGDVFEKRVDRLALTMTAAEVKEKLTSQTRKRAP